LSELNGVAASLPSSSGVIGRNVKLIPFLSVVLIVMGVLMVTVCADRVALAADGFGTQLRPLLLRSDSGNVPTDIRVGEPLREVV
jgi:hypothetical protein